MKNKSSDKCQSPLAFKKKGQDKSRNALLKNNAV